MVAIEQDMSRVGPYVKKKRATWLIWAGIGLALLGAGAYWLLRPKAEVHNYVTGHASKGIVIEQVEATGTVQATTQVQVSSQVSGRILRLYTDFNARVHAGDLLAELDPTPFQARLAQARASLAQAQANVGRAQADLVLARTNAERAQKMRSENLNAAADLDAALNAKAAAEAQLGVARASVQQAQAAVVVAQTDLNYTRIVAPVDGIVITRSVDVGQTVAASFQAPTLFVIVDDLARVQVLGDVDEAEVGKLREGMDVEVKVDAFTDDTFHGRIRELRYGSTVTSGVVTYPAVIDVDNPERKLRPGMTASIKVTTDRARDILRVPNAALRFTPASKDGDAAMKKNGGHGSGARQGESGASNAHQGTVWVLEGTGPDAKPRAVKVQTGITDGRYTVIVRITSGSLKEGDVVILDDSDTSTGGGPGGGSSGQRRFRII